MAAAVVDMARFSPDGRQFVVGSEDNTASLIDAASFSRRHILEGHTQTAFVHRSEFSPNSALVLTHAYQEPSVRLWDAETGTLRHLLDAGNMVIHTRFSPDSATIVTGLSDGRVMAWETGSGEKFHEWKAHESAVLNVTFHPSGERFITNSVDGAALWNLQSGTIEARFRGHSGIVLSARFNAAGDRVLTVGFDGRARVWDLRGNELLTIETGETILFGDWSPKGTRIVLTTQEGHIQVYDSISPAELGPPSAPLRDRVVEWRKRRSVTETK
jgi:WD40 repeat protein